MINKARAGWLAIAITTAYPATADARERRYQVANADDETPALTSDQIVSAPDWADGRIYPRASRWRNQEGDVTFQMIVGTNGTPSRCVIIESSGYAELDDGTCDLAMMIRFAPQDRTATFSSRLAWHLSDPMTFDVGRTTVRIDLADGVMRDCSVVVEGRVPPIMNSVACELIGDQAGYFFGPRPTLRTATVVLELLPTGQAPLPAVFHGSPIAVRRTTFRLTRSGEVASCEVAEERGFGSSDYAYTGACGFFLAQMSIRPARRRAEASGSFQISIYADEPIESSR